MLFEKGAKDDNYYHYDYHHHANSNNNNNNYNTANPLCKVVYKVVYYMNHTTGLCGSYSTQLYTTLHSFTQRFVHVLLQLLYYY